MRILFLGDIVGRPGRLALRDRLPGLRKDLRLDLVLANAENASGGLGVTAKSALELLGWGLDLLTSGNHVWKYPDIGPFLNRTGRMVRPANFPPGAPGKGMQILRLPGLPPVAVLNLQGRTFMEPIDCPFRTAEALLADVPEDVPVRLVDFHAEATSEKISLAWFLDGRVSAVLGSHTHVQTSDARILPGGTAALTDLGMCGPVLSCLGMSVAPILRRFTQGLPERWAVAEGPVELQGAVLEIDEGTGKALSIMPWRLAAPGA